MEFPYKTILVLGATSGIGLALAEKMISNGSHVIAVGRRQQNLDSLAKKHGADKLSPIRFDITDLTHIPDFVETVTKSHPTLDCVVLNSGIQRGLDFSKPETIDLDQVGTELTTNYLSHIHLTTHLLSFLQRQKTLTALIYITSGLALAPIPRCPNYCASKAATHHLLLCMREQLRGSNVRVVEVLPPAVRTELHDEKHQPDIKDGGRIGISIEEFMAEAWEGLREGREEVPVGTSRRPYEDGWEVKRQEQFRKMAEMMRK